ncbi:MAG TPA: hypothetical protein VE960_05940, partial [bacterium]|nr:hypothetical protein [bacterium]
MEFADAALQRGRHHFTAPCHHARGSVESGIEFVSDEAVLRPHEKDGRDFGGNPSAKMLQKMPATVPVFSLVPMAV